MMMTTMSMMIMMTTLRNVHIVVGDDVYIKTMTAIIAAVINIIIKIIINQCS